MAEKQYFLDTDGLAYYHEKISEKFATKTKVTEDIQALIEENNKTINEKINEQIASTNAAINDLTASVNDKASQESLIAIEDRVTSAETTLDTLVGIDFGDIEAIAGLTSDVTDLKSNVDILNTYKNSSSEALNKISETADENAAAISELTSWKGTTDSSILDLQEAGKGYATKSQIAQVVDEEGNIISTTIIQTVKDNKSKIGLSADDITFTADNYKAIANEIEFTTEQYQVIADKVDIKGKVTFESYTDTTKASVLTSVKVEYAKNQSSINAPTTGWSTTSPTWETGYYIWQRITRTYADGNSYFEDACIQGAKGEQGIQGPAGPQGMQGPKGDDGTGVAVKSSRDECTEVGDAYIDSDGNIQIRQADGSFVNGGQIKGPKGDSSYIHYAYSNAADGSLDFNLTDPRNRSYIGICVTNELTDPTDPSLYTWSYVKGERGLQGLQGEKGEQGLPGAAGTSSYFHIKYSINASGNPMIETPSTYIGTYVDNIKTDSTDYTKYTWSRFEGLQGDKGDQGIPGNNGEDGKTSYLHIAYATSSDGSEGFDLSNSSGKSYIGQYVDFEAVDSTNYTRYKWSKIKGEDGVPGKDGVNGADGKKLISVFQYAINNDIKNVPTSNWTTTQIAPTQDNPLRWIRQRLNYEGETTYTYTIPYLDPTNALGQWCASNDVTHIDGGKIYTGTIDASSLKANTITADQIDANSISAAVVTSATVNAVDINADKITTGTLAAGRIDANYIKSKKAEIESIVADKIEATSIDADNITTGTLSSKNKNFQIDLDEGTITSPGFNLDENGNASVIGTIISNAGSIGDFTINDSIYSGGKVFFDDNKDGVHLGADGIGLGKNKFTVNPEGYATMTSGQIGGWDIDQNSISNGGVVLNTDPNYKIAGSSVAISAGLGEVKTEKISKKIDLKDTSKVTISPKGVIQTFDITAETYDIFMDDSQSIIFTYPNEKAKKVRSSVGKYYVHSVRIGSKSYDEVERDNNNSNSFSVRIDDYTLLYLEFSADYLYVTDDGISSATIEVEYSNEEYRHVEELDNYEVTNVNNVIEVDFGDRTSVSTKVDISCTVSMYPVSTFINQAGQLGCENGSIDYLTSKNIKTDKLSLPDDRLEIGDISTTNISVEHIEGAKFNSDTYRKYLEINSSLYPVNSIRHCLGSVDNKWSVIYAQTGTIQTSDANEKTNIEILSDKYSTLFDNLNPVSYKFKQNESGRTHIGLIAQEVETALETAGLTSQDFAGLCFWDKADGTKGYGLRYEEFIALNTHEIQKLKKENETLNQENADIKAQLKTIEDKLQLYIDYVNKL